MEFHYNTCGKMREIFAEHCNLSVEQYEEISGQFLYLVTDFQEGEPMEDVDKRVGYMRAVFEFLTNTKELTLKEQYELNELLDDVVSKAIKTASILAAEKGKVL